jgi:hypothetical protein
MINIFYELINNSNINELKEMVKVLKREIKTREKEDK